MSSLYGPQAISSFTAAFLASGVEFVEALTIVLAVGSTRGWRAALWGAASGVVLLCALVLGFGSAITRIRLESLQLFIGVLLLLFGLKWLRKAILRSAGVIAFRDEEKIFIEQKRFLGQTSSRFLPFLTSFKAVTLEGLEVVFIVVATGGETHSLSASSIGALAAGGLVILAGLLIHRPLARIPENTLKFTVGVLLSAFGSFWVGEGLGFSWPGSDGAILFLVAGYLVASLVSVKIFRFRRS